MSIVPVLVADDPNIRVPAVPERVSTEPALNFNVPGPGLPPPPPSEIVFATASLTSTVTMAAFLTTIASVAVGRGEIVLQFVSAVIVIFRALPSILEKQMNAIVKKENVRA
jgi:hypothetical protein